MLKSWILTFGSIRKKKIKGKVLSVFKKWSDCFKQVFEPIGLNLTMSIMMERRIKTGMEQQLKVKAEYVK